MRRGKPNPFVTSRTRRINVTDIFNERKRQRGGLLIASFERVDGRGTTVDAKGQ